MDENINDELMSENMGMLTEITLANEHINTLSSLSIVLEKTEDKTDTFNKLAYIAIEDINAKLGITGTVNISTESIADTIVRIFESIKKAFKIIWSKIFEFFKNFFQNFEKVIKRCEDIARNVNSIKSYEKQENYFDNQYIASSLSSNGKVDGHGLLFILKNHLDVFNNFSNIRQLLEDELGSLTNGFESGNLTTVSLAKFNDVNKQFIQEVLKLSSNTTKKKEEDVEKYVTEITGISNGKKITLAVELKNIFAEQLGNLTIPKVNLTLDSNDEPVADKCKVLEKEEILQVCEKIIKLATVNDKFKKSLDKFEIWHKRFDSFKSSMIAKLIEVQEAKMAEALKKQQRPANAISPEASLKLFRYILSLMSAYNSVLASVYSILPIMNLKVCTSSIAYMEKSLKSYIMEGDLKAAGGNNFINATPLLH